MSGPPDDDRYDRMRRRVLWRLPTGLYLLGSRAGDRRNLMTQSWVTQVAMEPKAVAVSVEVEAFTHGLIEEGAVFAVSLLRPDDRALVRKFVKPAEWDGAESTLNGVATFEATTGAPILEGAAAWLDCEVRERVRLTSHTLFVGEVVGCGEADPAETVVLRMEDTRMSYGG
ncbi:MAG: flavin reductase family protein [Acidimicrobiales bacterium]